MASSNTPFKFEQRLFKKIASVKLPKRMTLAVDESLDGGFNL